MKTRKNIVFLFLFGLLAVLTGAATSAKAQKTYNIGVYMSYKGPENSSQIWRGGDLWYTHGIIGGFRSKALFDSTIVTAPEISRVLNKSITGGGSDKVKQLISPAAIKAYFTPHIEKAMTHFYKSKNASSPIHVRLFLITQGVSGFLARYIASKPSLVGLKHIHECKPGTICKTGNKRGKVIANVTSFTVLAVGVPFQGSVLSLGSLEPGQSTILRDVQTPIHNYEQTLEKALKTPQPHKTSFWKNVGHFLLNAAAKFGASFLGPELTTIADNIFPTVKPKNSTLMNLLTAGENVGKKYAKNIYGDFFNFNNPSNGKMRLKGFQSMISMPRVDYQAAQAIEEADVNFKTTNSDIHNWLAPGQRLPNKMNALPNPAHYRSIIGAEEAPIPYRIISAIRLSKNHENEPAVVKLYKSFISTAKGTADEWNFQAHKFFNFFHKKRDRNYRDNWRAAQYALQNVNVKWATIIGSYKDVQVPMRIKVPDGYGPCPPPNSGPGVGPPRISGPGGAKCLKFKWKTVMVTERIQLKNDGFMAPKFAVWSHGDSYTNKSEGNYFYGDTGPKGGYNDLELLNYKRVYNNPGTSDKGNRERPMHKAEKWILQIEGK